MRPDAHKVDRASGDGVPEDVQPAVAVTGADVGRVGRERHELAVVGDRGAERVVRARRRRAGLDADDLRVAAAAEVDLQVARRVPEVRGRAAERDVAVRRDGRFVCAGVGDRSRAAVGPADQRRRPVHEVALVDLHRAVGVGVRREIGRVAREHHEAAVGADGGGARAAVGGGPVTWHGSQAPSCR